MDVTKLRSCKETEREFHQVTQRTTAIVNGNYMLQSGNPAWLKEAISQLLLPHSDPLEESFENYFWNKQLPRCKRSCNEIERILQSNAKDCYISLSLFFTQERKDLSKAISPIVLVCSMKRLISTINTIGKAMLYSHSIYFPSSN